MGIQQALQKKSRVISLFLAFVLLILISSLYFKWFEGIKGDGIYYYSYAVSLLEDGDFDLQDQFDRRLPSGEEQTVAGGNYFINNKTGKAFSLHNPGTGLFMIPMIGIGRAVSAVLGLGHQNLFDPFYQEFAGYTSVLLTAISLFLLYLILKRFYSTGISLGLPVLFLFGTNWLFYTTVFADFSHACSLFCVTALLYVFFRLKERFSFFAAALFGFIGGLGFTTRNFNLVLFGFLFLLFLFFHVKNSKVIFSKKNVLTVVFVGLFFLIGASPQLMVNQTQHGNPLTFGYRAIEDSVRSPGFDVNPDFKTASSLNLYLLYTNLFNSENGLFYSHPLYLFGLLGLLFLRHKDKKFQWITDILLLAMLLFWLVDASYFDNWFNRAAGSGFGHRRFISFLPLFIIGGASLLERAKSSKYLKFVIGAVVSVFLVSSVASLHVYMTDFASFYANKGSLYSLYKLLLGRVGSLVLLVLVFFGLIYLMRKKNTENPVSSHSIFRMSAVLVICIVPFFLFRPKPEYLRYRHMGKEGFFSMWNLNSGVKLDGKTWGLPDNQRRPLNSKRAKIELPAPLMEGDTLLLKAAPAAAPNGIMKVFLGEETLATWKIGKGKQIYQCKLQKDTKEKRILTIDVQTEHKGPPYLMVYEGRIIYRDQKQGIKENLDWVKVEDGQIGAAGWCLDDFGIESVRLFYSSREKKRVLVGFIPRMPQSMEERPDIERIFILYPELDLASFKGYFPLKEEMLGTSKLDFWVEVTSNDGEVKKSRVISIGFGQNRGEDP